MVALDEVVEVVVAERIRLEGEVLVGAQVVDPELLARALVSAEVIALREGVWFRKLNSKQIDLIQPYLNEEWDAL